MNIGNVWWYPARFLCIISVRYLLDDFHQDEARFHGIKQSATILEVFVGASFPERGQEPASGVRANIQESKRNRRTPAARSFSSFRRRRRRRVVSSTNIIV